MLTNGRALKNMQAYKTKTVLELHPYLITKPSNDKGRWQTYIKSDGKRKILRSSTYENLIDKLYSFYVLQNGDTSLTMDRLFLEWLSYKESITDSMKTIRRHEQHWNKYFSSLKGKKVSSYDRLELQKDCNILVKENHLSSKEWQNVKTILFGMFDYAFEKHYIDDNIMRNVKITVKFRQVNKKSGLSETYQTDELKALYHYLDDEFSRTGDTALLAIRFNFYVGCRVGELVALKWCDYQEIKYLHICREEVKESVRVGDSWKDVYSVVEHTKTNQDRFVPLPPKAISLLNEIRLKTASTASLDGFIFTRDNKRLTSRQINYALEKACRKLGIEIKRSHKIRKTVASRLNAGNLPLDFIRELLGHASLNTTLGYIYNPLSEKETYQLMVKAL